MEHYVVINKLDKKFKLDKMFLAKSYPGHCSFVN